MQFTSARVPVEAGKQSPVDRLKRVANDGSWCVPFSPILFDAPIEWRRYSRSQDILIPTYLYRATVNPAEAFGFMVQVGMQAALTCPIVGISRIHLVYGDPVQQAHDETTGATEYLIYLGFGFLSRER